MELLSKNCKVNGLEALEGTRESYGVVQEGKGSLTTQRLLRNSHSSSSTPYQYGWYTSIHDLLFFAVKVVSIILKPLFGDPGICIGSS